MNALTRKAASITGIFSMLLLAIAIFLSQFVGTCTQGDSDHFLAGIVLGVPLTAVTIVLFWLARGVTRAFARAQTAATVAPAFVGTTLGGHHLCGLNFDDYLEYSSAFDRFIPLVDLTLLASVFAAALTATVSDSRPGKLLDESRNDRAGDPPR